MKKRRIRQLFFDFYLIFLIGWYIINHGKDIYCYVTFAGNAFAAEGVTLSGVPVG